MNQKIINILVVITLIVAIVGLFIPVPALVKDKFGGLVHNVLESFDEGIAVDGTVVIDGSGNWDGAITGTTGTFSSTLGITGNMSTAADLVVNNTICAGMESVSSGSFTLTAAQICDACGLLFTVNSSGNLTTPTSASLGADCLDTVEDSKQFTIFNTTASAQTCTLVAGTGIDFNYASAGGSTTVLSQGESAILNFTKIGTTSISVQIVEFKSN